MRLRDGSEVLKIGTFTIEMKICTVHVCVRQVETNPYVFFDIAIGGEKAGLLLITWQRKY